MEDLDMKLDMKELDMAVKKLDMEDLDMKLNLDMATVSTAARCTSASCVSRQSLLGCFPCFPANATCFVQAAFCSAELLQAMTEPGRGREAQPPHGALCGVSSDAPPCPSLRTSTSAGKCERCGCCNASCLAWMTSRGGNTRRLS